MKHKHCELIKAWADGAEIQYKDEGMIKWQDVWDNTPGWCNKTEYRIKPKTTKYRLYLYQVGNSVRVGSHNKDQNINPETWQIFIKWLGDWQEVEM